jgi:hypothetical protein
VDVAPQKPPSQLILPIPKKRQQDILFCRPIGGYGRLWMAYSLLSLISDTVGGITVNKKNYLSLAVCGVLCLSASALGSVIDISLNVDSAPNIYYQRGQETSPYSIWWDGAQQDIVADTFTNMENGSFPGQLLADPYDEIVYGSGDMGKRMHWVFWIPGADLADALADGRLQTRLIFDWDGQMQTFDFDPNDRGVKDIASLDSTLGWRSDGLWYDYDDGQNIGVIGTFGWADWAKDDNVAPGDTNGDDDDEVDQADIDYERSKVLANRTYVLGQVRYKSSTTSDWEVRTLKVDIAAIPEPTTFVIWGMIGTLAFCIGGSRKRFF